MRRWSSQRLISLTSSLVLATLPPVHAQQQPRPGNNGSVAGAAETSPTVGASGALTGKERLGEKWTDEQRVDNCKVPLDKRGTVPRPDTCATASTP